MYLWYRVFMVAGCLVVRYVVVVVVVVVVCGGGV
jgi:hypothetical protein